MLRATTLLIVMVLAGGPVGSLACDLWCSTSAADKHHDAVGCHDASRAAATGQHISSTTPCGDDATSIAAFLVEARHADSVTLAAMSQALGAIVPADKETAARWCVVDVQPPRPPSSRSVLRV